MNEGRRDLLLREGKQGVCFSVRVVPGASGCLLQWDGQQGLKLRVDAPPVDGEANKRVIAYFAKRVFGVAKRSVCIERGLKGRNKVIAVDLPLSDVRAQLERILAGQKR